MSPADPVRERAFGRVGRTLRGKFHIDALLGIGGMASVYAATHRNGSRLAIKILHEHVSTSAEVRRLFRGEGLAANRIKHASIVPVLDDDVTEDGCAFLVMPLLRGETVQARRERRGSRLPTDEALLITAAVLDALRAAHAVGVVHRDVKPENIFVGSDGAIHVLDFGVARIARSGGDAIAVTWPAEIVATAVGSRVWE